jgi:hypothetical protein
VSEQVERTAVQPTLGSLLRQRPTGDSDFLPAAAIAQKAKVVSDGIVAGLEMASLDVGRDPASPLALVRQIGEALASGVCSKEASAEVGAFLRPALSAQELLATRTDAAYFPLGLYCWHPALSEVFRRDRYLQRRALEPSLADCLARLVASHPGLRHRYEQHLTRIARLTNRLTQTPRDLRARMAASDASAGRSNSPAPEVLFPPSAAPENAFRSTADFIAAVRSGELSLVPSPQDGFYVHQLYSLEALLCPDRTAESGNRRVGPRYAEELRSLGVGILAMSRETHIKQLEVLYTATPGVPRAVRRVRPNLTIEPQPTYFQRTAAAFAFLRQVIVEGWGEGALAWKQWRRTGEISSSIGDGISQVIALGEACSLVSRAELQVSPVGEQALETARSTARGLLRDPDLDEDLRGVVPLEQRSEVEFRVLANVGWEQRLLQVDFAALPQPAPADVVFEGEAHFIAVPATYEWTMPSLQSPQKFQALCDQAGSDLRRLAAVLGASPVAKPGIVREGS